MNCTRNAKIAVTDSRGSSYFKTVTDSFCTNFEFQWKIIIDLFYNFVNVSECLFQIIKQITPQLPEV